MRVIASLLFGLGMLAVVFGALNTDLTLAETNNGTCNVPGDHGTIQLAVDDPACSLINLGSGTFVETVVVNRSLTLQGQGSQDSIIDGDASGNVITVQPGHAITIANVTIMNGLDGNGGGGGILNISSHVFVMSSSIVSNTAYDGGGIRNMGNASNGTCATLHIVDSNLSHNSAVNRGGAIASENYGCSLIVEDSRLSDNATSQYGGAIYSVAGTTLVTDSVLSQNVASFGGGIYIDSGSLRLTGGEVSENQAWSGGGVHLYSSEEHLISNTQLNANEAGPLGGGLYNRGKTRIVTSLLTDNSAGDGTSDYCGGAIFNEWHMSVEGSEIRDNIAARGGGVCNGGSLNVSNSLFVRNEAVRLDGGDSTGGGIQSNSPLTVTNSTFAENLALDSGGGISILGTDGQPEKITLVNVTLSDNSAGNGGGLFVEQDPFDPYLYPGIVTVVNSIIANSGGGDCSGPVISGGYNIDTDASCGLIASGDQSGVDPMLYPLQNNGGPTKTYALGILSPAIDAADNAACPAADQRGVARPIDGEGDGSAICDVGAFESETRILHDAAFLPIILRLE